MHTNCSHKLQSVGNMNEPQSSLPDHLVQLLKTLPRRVNRRTGARLVRQHFFPVGDRALERWPLGIKFVHGQATAETAEIFEVAQQRLDAAPVERSGRPDPAEQDTTRQAAA